MNTINFDADKWREAVDIYSSVLMALKSPEWHGKNINAMIDSIIYGGINQIEPPFCIEIHYSRDTPDSVLKEIRFVQEQINAAREEKFRSQGKDVDVTILLIEKGDH